VGLRVVTSAVENSGSSATARRWREESIGPASMNDLSDPQSKIRELEARLAARQLEIDRLRTQQEQGDRFFSLTLDLLAVASAHTGRWVEVNPAMTRTLGWSREEFLSTPFLEIVHPEDLARSQAATAALSEGKPLLQFENRVRCKDGSYRWIEWQTMPYGEEGLMYCAARDVTDRVRAEEKLRESEELFRLTFDQSPVGAAIVSLEHRFQRVNAELCRITGYSEAELLGMGWRAITHPQDLAAAVHRAKELIGGKIDRCSAEKRYVRKDGSDVWVSLSVALIRSSSGTPLYTLPMVTDISAQKALEQALREADRRKDEFLATLAHELRNPLAPLQNALEIQRLCGDDRAMAARAGGMAQRQVTHLVRLVEDLLDVSRITGGMVALRKEQSDLVEIARIAIESTPEIEAYGHRVCAQLPPGPVLLEADAVRLTQVLVNLLSNAAKHSGPSRHIWLTVEARDGEAVVAVRDDGLGIAPDVLPRVFDMFARGSGGRAGGLGVGLTLARQLVEMHGGSIEAHSGGAGCGSEFIVRLPRSGSTPDAVQAPDCRPAEPCAGRVLVVDDNRDAAESVARLLELIGTEARVVHDGPAALAAFESFRPSVVFLDIGMPGMDGYEVARRMRARAAEGGPLLVALTGWGQEQDRARAAEAGFDRHVTKPAALETLRDVLAGGQAA
jgi:PAS domain S-box-containing protein